MMNLIKTTVEHSGFKQKQILLELGLNLKYMTLPENIEVVPLDVHIVGNQMTLCLGIKTHSFLYGNVYKKYIEGFLYRYFLGKYNISVVFSGV